MDPLLEIQIFEREYQALTILDMAIHADNHMIGVLPKDRFKLPNPNSACVSYLPFMIEIKRISMHVPYTVRGNVGRTSRLYISHKAHIFI